MYFLVVIGYESERLDREGNPRIQKSKYLIEAESVEEASMVASKYRSEDKRSSESISISKFSLECVIDKRNEPEYYK